jgi:phage I-like protein
MLNAQLSLAPVLMAAAQTGATVDAPEWIHLLPTSGGSIATIDQRGPFHLTDAAALIAASFADTDRLAIDENHATDLAAPQGQPAPARGWIVAMEARADGIWGQVEWTESGRALVADRAYRAISPVIAHDKQKRIGRILRASLVNRPNLKGLTTLNQETSMSFMDQLAAKLGLNAEGLSEDAILVALQSVLDKQPAETALQSALTEIGTVLGVAADQEAIVAAAKAAKTAKPAEITALQAELTKVSTQLSDLTGARLREKAEGFVDGEIKRGRAGVKPLREHYITRHMTDATAVEKELASLPVLGPSGATVAAPQKDGELSLNAEQANAARLLGIPQADVLKTLKAEQKEAL